MRACRKATAWSLSQYDLPSPHPLRGPSNNDALCVRSVLVGVATSTSTRIVGILIGLRGKARLGDMTWLPPSTDFCTTTERDVNIANGH